MQVLNIFGDGQNCKNQTFKWLYQLYKSKYQKSFFGKIFTVMLFHMYQVFSSLLGHLNFSLHFFSTFMEQLFNNHPISCLAFKLLSFLLLDGELDGFCFRFAFDVLGPFALLLLVVKVLAISANAGVGALGGAGDVSATVIRDNTSGVCDQLFDTVAECRALGLDANVSSAFSGTVFAFGLDSSGNHVAIKLRAPAELVLRGSAALNVSVETVLVAIEDQSTGVAGSSQFRRFGRARIQFGRHNGRWHDRAVGPGALDSGAFDLGAIDVEAEGLVLDCVVLVSLEGVVFVTLRNITVLRERKSDGVSPAFLAIGRRGRCGRGGS